MRNTNSIVHEQLNRVYEKLGFAAGNHVSCVRVLYFRPIFTLLLNLTLWLRWAVSLNSGDALPRTSKIPEGLSNG